MNLAITTTSTSTWKAIKRNYFFGCTAALLAVAALGANSMMSNDAGSRAVETSPARSTLNIEAAFRPASPAMTYYIVGSEEQLLTVQAEATSQVEDNAVYDPNNGWKFSILLANTPATTEDALDIVDAAKASWRAAGASGLQIIDLR